MLKKENNFDPTKAHKYLHLFQSIVHFVDKWGFLKILKTIFFILIVWLLILFMFKPEVILERWQIFTIAQHDKLIDYRKKITPQINVILEKLLRETNANRALVWELHNNTTNIQGLPFLYMSSKFEACDGDTMIDDYINLSTTKYPLFSYIHDKGSFYGDMVTLKLIDKKFFQRLTMNDVQHLGMIQLYGPKTPIGVLSISYTVNSPIDRDKAINLMRRASTQITSLLDYAAAK